MALKTLATIEAHQKLTHSGDLVIIGDVGANAVIEVTGGSLTIDGAVGDSVTIKLKSHRFSLLCCICSVGSEELHIRGTVGEQVCITAGNADICLESAVGAHSQVETANGSIKLNDVAKAVIVETRNGDVNAGIVGKGATVKTSNGDVTVTEVQEEARVETKNGDISATKVKAGATVTSHNGDICVNQATSYADIKSHNGDLRIGVLYQTVALSGEVESYQTTPALY